MTKDKDLQKLASGLLFFSFGVFATSESRRYEIGSLLHPGPGFFPFLLGAVLIGLGSLGFVAGWRAKTATSITSGWSRAAVLIPLAVIWFGLSIDRFGMVPATIVATLLCGLAARKVRPLETLLMCVFVAAFAVAVFVWGLGMPFAAIGALGG